MLFIVTTVLLCLFGFYIERQNPSVAFYYLPTRSWEMLVGGIAFLSEDKINTKYKKYLSILGYVVLLLCFAFLREDMSWPGLYTLVPVIGTFLIIVSNYNDFSILKSRIIGYVGKISYSLYLWHWPIIVFCNYIGIKLTMYSVLAYIAASFLLASISYHLIENYKSVTISKVRMGLALLVLITGLFTYKSINDVAFKKKTLEIARYKETHEEEAVKQLSRYTCFIDSKSNGAKFNKEKCLYLDPAKRNYILIGDSHAAHLSQSLKESLEKSNIHILQASVSGCTPVLKTRGEDRCTEVIGFMYNEFIPRNASDIDGVIISSNWVNNKKKGLLINKIHATINYLKKLNIPVILLGQNETYTIPYTSIAAREFEYSKPLGSNYINPKSADINHILSKEFKSLYIDIFSLDVCPKFSPSFTPYMSDQNHFTKYGADCAVKEILKNPDFIKFVQLK